MIKKADILERLGSLVGKELSDENLHVALLCEERDLKKLRRFYLGKQKYIQYNIQTDQNSAISPFVTISVMGNPYNYKMDLTEIEDQMILSSKPVIHYSYL